MKKPILHWALLFLLGLTIISAQTVSSLRAADSSSSSNESTPPLTVSLPDEMVFVDVHDEKNQPDGAPYAPHGSVSYHYSIGKYEVTAEEYCAFLNAVASTNNDPHSLYDPRMSTDANVASIERHGTAPNYTYEIINDTWNRAKFPIAYVNWYSAARFCNWMAHGCPTGDAVTDDTTEHGAYSFFPSPNDTTHYIVHEHEDGPYFIPTEDEWYKAAYFLNHGDRPLYWDYPTQSDAAPSNNTNSWFHQANYRCGYFENTFSVEDGPPYLTPVGTFKNSPGPYGTYDMGGNVFEMTTARYSHNSKLFVARGGSWNSSYSYFFENDLEKGTRKGFDPSTPSNEIGFRIVKRDRSSL